MAEDAIERNLQIIGEAVNHLPMEVTDGHPDIPWPQIRGFSNILVHQYFKVEAEVVRDVVETYLPSLAAALRSHSAADWPRLDFGHRRARCSNPSTVCSPKTVMAVPAGTRSSSASTCSRRSAGPPVTL